MYSTWYPTYIRVEERRGEYMKQSTSMIIMISPQLYYSTVQSKYYLI